MSSYSPSHLQDDNYEQELSAVWASNEGLHVGIPGRQALDMFFAGCTIWTFRLEILKFPCFMHVLSYSYLNFIWLVSKVSGMECRMNSKSNHRRCSEQRQRDKDVYNHIYIYIYVEYIDTVWIKIFLCIQFRLERFQFLESYSQQ